MVRYKTKTGIEHTNTYQQNEARKRAWVPLGASKICTKCGLRNRNDFRLQMATTTAMQKSLFYKGLKLYNSIPNYLKFERNENEFSKECVKLVKNINS